MECSAPLYVRLLSGIVRPFPDFDFNFIKPVRERAVALLQLKSGARVIDAGCGSGGSFPFLVKTVGPLGKIIGIELSSMSASHAKHRAEKNGWNNVEIITAAAKKANLADDTFDGLLMFAAPDVYATEDSIDRLIPHLRTGARVVFFGGKRSTRWCGWMLNGLLHFALTRLSLPTTPGLEIEPWSRFATHLVDLQIDEYFYGWMFLASGTIRR